MYEYTLLLAQLDTERARGETLCCFDGTEQQQQQQQHGQ